MTDIAESQQGKGRDMGSNALRTLKFMRHRDGASPFGMGIDSYSAKRRYLPL